MSEFSLQLEPKPDAASDDPCRLRIGAGKTVFTRLLRNQGHQPDDAVLAAPAPLAYWFCDNWWRLRWESIPASGPTAAWRLSHDIASVGGGYAWPRLCIWGDLDRIGLLSQADPIGVIGPVRYLTDALLYVPATGYEAQVDQFLDRVADAQQGFGSDRQALRALIGALRAERTDPAVARWRRIEARLGCDPDQGPDEAIEALGALANHFGLEAVEEAIAARPGGDASQVLERAVSMVRAAGQRCDFSALLSAVSPMLRTPSEPPWMAAELAAQRVRAAAGIQRGPLHNKRLAELLGTTTEVFQQTASHERLAYGLRLGEQGPTGPQSITLRAKWQEGRRFTDLLEAA